MKRVLIVRHGDTFLPGEPPRRIGARSDMPLTQRGEAQALEVATWLLARDLEPDSALAGPLQRATRTAEIILNAFSDPCPLGAAAWLNEVDYGPDEGCPEIEVVERIGTDALARWDRLGEPAPGWHVDRSGRIEECRAGLLALPSGTSLLATSNGAARLILLALGLDAAASSLKLRTGAIGEVQIAERAAQLLRWDVRPGEQDNVGAVVGQTG